MQLASLKKPKLVGGETAPQDPELNGLKAGTP
jgi:hypothetical protein